MEIRDAALGAGELCPIAGPTFDCDRPFLAVGEVCPDEFELKYNVLDVDKQDQSGLWGSPAMAACPLVAAGTVQGVVEAKSKSANAWS